MTITSYLQNIASVADDLAAIGDPVADKDLILYILHGLSPDFNLFVTVVE